MIPKRIDPKNPSLGEIEFFKRISQEEDIPDWTILHSLNIAPNHHQTRIMGEIDFLAIIPNLGMIAIEIKAHREIKVEDGVWFLGKVIEVVHEAHLYKLKTRCSAFKNTSRTIIFF